jgi:hypothetical protein
MAKIYVATSWKNPFHSEVIARIREFGHEVYDFKNPTETPEKNGFHWKDILEYVPCRPEVLRGALGHPAAVSQFNFDKDALDTSDACLVVQDCGKSAHLELGYMAGLGKKCAVYFPRHDMLIEPELMICVARHILIGGLDLDDWLESL